MPLQKNQVLTIPLNRITNNATAFINTPTAKH